MKYATKESWSETVEKWRPVTLAEWDKLSDSQREILLVRDKKTGRPRTVFVGRV